METWKPIIGYEELYKISNYGNVMKCDTLVITKRGYTQKYKSQLMTPKIRSGYYCVWLRDKNGNKKTFLLHRLLYQHFKDDFDDSKVINHIDGDKLNNSLDNLECVTQKYNIKHSIVNGKHPTITKWKNQYGEGICSKLYKV